MDADMTTPNKCEHYTPWEGGDIQENHDGSARCTDCGKRWVPSDVLEEAATVIRRLRGWLPVPSQIEWEESRERLTATDRESMATLARIDAVLGRPTP